MLRIGDFSRLSRVTVKTLRYYDEIGLLKPVYVDRSTGYRYYSAEQLPRLGYIILLKELRVALEDISGLLVDGAPAEKVQAVLRLKQDEARLRVTEEEQRLARLEELLRQIAKEGKMTDYQVTIKRIEPFWVASMRGILPTYGDVGEFYGEIFKHLAKKFIFKPSGPVMLICHDAEFKEKDVDVEVVVPIKKSVASSDKVKVYQLPLLEEAACIIYKGAYEGISEAYNGLMAWIEKNSYQVAGPDREIYLASPYDTKDPAKYITEIQFPVTNKAAEAAAKAG